MRNLAIDQNSRACVFSALGKGKNYSSGDKLPKLENAVIRIVNSETTKAVVRYTSDKDTDGVVIPAGGTFWTQVDGEVEVVSGKINVMF